MRLKWHTRIFWAFSMIWALATMGCAPASERDLRREIEILRKNQEVLRKELVELKALIQASRPTRPNIRDAEVELKDDPIEGDRAASLTLIEFTDYQ